jgi:hypothetical protein
MVLSCHSCDADILKSSHTHLTADGLYLIIPACQHRNPSLQLIIVHRWKHFLVFHAVHDTFIRKPPATVHRHLYIFIDYLLFSLTLLSCTHLCVTFRVCMYLAHPVMVESNGSEPLLKRPKHTPGPAPLSVPILIHTSLYTHTYIHAYIYLQ